jgi:arsenate reductase-like glutaredoxin family protein
MRKGWFLSTCSTCQRIIKSLPNVGKVEWQDIKTSPVSQEDLKMLVTLAGGVEPLFSRKARNYRILGLHERELLDSEMAEWIVKDYTFLKRPVVVIDGQLFAGNSPAVVAGLSAAMEKI